MRSPELRDAYLALLEDAILNLRMRIRYGEEVSMQEIADLLSALHNIPPMLRNAGGWHIEPNIDGDLKRYDEKWLGHPGSELRASLVDTLRRAREGKLYRHDPER